MPSAATRTALTVLGTVGAVGAGAAIWGIGIERYLFRSPSSSPTSS
ncbi:MAG: hypothetical protein K0R99_5045 [Microbacterium sp.]|nr:hypothetical protein [Microbacterium sp.]